MCCHVSQNLHLGNVVTPTTTRLGIWQSLPRAQNSELNPKEEEAMKVVKTLFTGYQHSPPQLDKSTGGLSFCMVGL